MSLNIVFKIFVFISLIYSFKVFWQTQKFIQKLPTMTKPKYEGLKKFGIKILVLALFLFIVSIFVSNKIISIIISCFIMYMLVVLISELSVLKEYVHLKRKTK